MIATKLFELTDYPRIFKKCYWGNFLVNEAGESIRNRNDFVKEYGLKEFIEARSPESRLGFFDHCELYRCKDGVVYVVSHSRKDNELDQCAERMGFKKYKNQYVDGSTTYVQVFPDKDAYNRYMKTH